MTVIVVSAAPSATVMLVRDRPAFEVLMVQRHHEIDFASGALVFPGGKGEGGEGGPAGEPHCFGWDEVPPDERALRVCAIREAFEESGILIARHAGDAAWEIGTRAALEREALARGELSFLGLVAGLAVKLDLGAMALFAHWITPASMRKRFDTRFFLMTAPEDQIAACDGCETVDAEWVTPDEALRLRESGERIILFPTRLNLELLARSASVADAFASLKARPVVTIEPLVEQIEGGMLLTIPPDAGYGVVEPQRL
ncbi:NUDIX hydrolase [uncultured Enterovirga sp.]|uniref:NUDIX hydrolase n=1 Tax=uncultured Enterovirga sp. TaxID=2026352 RepID=UPI0035CBA128